MISMIMDILIGAGGWTLGAHLLISKKEYRKSWTQYTIFRIISWTMVWIWVCYKFI